jgi:hypothetical protein
MKKIFNMKNTIFTILALVIIVSVVFTFIIVKADYSFEIKFNNEQLNFFDGETLYFNDAVNLDFAGSGYTTKLNGDKFKNNITIDEDGTYTLSIRKLLKDYLITIEVNTNPDFYLVDKEGNIIHNYLSNSNPFKVIRSNDDINVYVNNMVYNDDVLVLDAGNYVVSTDDDSYTVNILEINK